MTPILGAICIACLALLVQEPPRGAADRQEVEDSNQANRTTGDEYEGNAPQLELNTSSYAEDLKYLVKM